MHWTLKQLEVWWVDGPAVAPGGLRQRSAEGTRSTQLHLPGWAQVGRDAAGDAARLSSPAQTLTVPAFLEGFGVTNVISILDYAVKKKISCKQAAPV